MFRIVGMYPLLSSYCYGAYPLPTQPTSNSTVKSNQSKPSQPSNLRLLQSQPSQMLLLMMHHSHSQSQFYHIIILFVAIHNFTSHVVCTCTSFAINGTCFILLWCIPILHIHFIISYGERHDPHAMTMMTIINIIIHSFVTIDPKHHSSDVSYIAIP
jgi:hypothetical protein